MTWGWRAVSDPLRKLMLDGSLRAMSEYHWPHPEATEAVTRLLSLPAHGQEQDWEIELADSTRLGEFLELFESDRLDLEGRSALALLILFSITYADGPVKEDILMQIRKAMLGDAEVHRRMKSYWGKGFLEHEKQVQALIA